MFDEIIVLTSQRISTLRQEKEWTQEELAKKVGFKSKTTVAKWETETSDNIPRGRELVKLSYLFGVSTDYILGLTNKRNWE